MKKLFLIDGAMRPAKTEIVKYLEELSNNHHGGEPSKNFLLHKFSTREKGSNEFTDFETDKELVEKIKQDCADKKFSWISYQYAKHTYAIEKEKLDKSLDEHENTFLIIRSTELIAELKKKYEVRGYKVIPVYIYSDKKTIAEAYAIKYQDVDSAMSDAFVSLPDRTERLQKADSDYENAMAEASNIYDEVLIYSEKDAVGSASMRTKLYGLIKKYNDVLETNSIFVIHSYRNINDANSLFETIKSSAEEYLGQPKPMVDSLLYGTGSYLISETVYEAIEKSDFIICDISSDRCNDCKKPEALTQGVSANIWIELGYALATLRNRRVLTANRLALIRKINSSGTETIANELRLPADVQGYNVMQYQDENELKGKLKGFFGKNKLIM